MAETAFWLWPETAAGNGQRLLLRWWHRCATGTMPATLPSACPTLCSALEGHCLSLQACLPRAFYHGLTEAIRQEGSAHLNLCQGLPDEWQRLPWEWLHLDGRPLHGRLLAVRYRPRVTTPMPARGLGYSAPAPLAAPARDETGANLLLHLFPPAETPPMDGCAGLGMHIRTGVAARRDAARQDLSALNSVWVYAHGSESAQGVALLDEQGREWQLPRGRPLPPLVVLLACADREGGLLDYARQLLRQGAHTVIAPVAKLDARAAVRCMEAFLPVWQNGGDAASALLQAQAATDAGHGARRLLLLGRGDLQFGPPAGPQEWPLEALREQWGGSPQDAAGDANPAVLAAVLERLTLDQTLRTGGCGDADQALRRALGIDYGDTAGERRLLGGIHRCLDGLSPLAQAWLLPFALVLAESHDHRRLRDYERRLERLDAPLPEAPQVQWFRSKAPYRQGRYADAMGHIGAGLSLLDPSDPGQRSGSGLLGTLLNILIDLDLPEPAEAVYQLLVDTLERTPQGETRRWHEHTRLDRAARLALRSHRPDRAVALLERKRANAREDGEDGHRELAWLLYASAWENARQGEGYAREAKDILAGAGDAPGWGNETRLYLLRALALWAWRGRDAEAARLVRGQMELIEKRLYAHDPGPPALIIGFLTLHDRDSGGESSGMPSWEAAATGLEGHGYCFELGILDALLGNRNAAATALGHFHSQRRGALARADAFPPWLKQPLGDWRRERREREALETRLLTAEGGTNPCTLAEHGVLPL